MSRLRRVRPLDGRTTSSSSWLVEAISSIRSDAMSVSSAAEVGNAPVSPSACDAGSEGRAHASPPPPSARAVVLQRTGHGRQSPVASWLVVVECSWPLLACQVLDLGRAGGEMMGVRVRAAAALRLPSPVMPPPPPRPRPLAALFRARPVTSPPRPPPPTSTDTASPSPPYAALLPP
jgi:hypothetical protein